MPLRDGLSAVARDCSCSLGKERPALLERAMELTALRQMNRIILSLFQGEGDAAARALDLLLSAPVVLLDAKGSWLEYEDESTASGRPAYLVKGDERSVKAFVRDQIESAVVVPVCNSGFRGRLGVLAPADFKRARTLLPLMAQECEIVFEIEGLFRLLRLRLTRVLGGLDSAVILVDRDQRINYLNPAAERLLGRHSLELIGTDASSLNAPWRAPLTARPEVLERGVMDPVGPVDAGRWVDWQISPLREEGPAVTGWVILAEERTDYHRWQAAGRQAERLAITASLVGTLAHELRNPLAAASGLLQLMSRKPEKGLAYADLTIRELDRVIRLLNEFLLLGKPSQMAGEAIDLKGFVQELLPLLRGEGAAQGAEVVADLSEVSPVRADAAQLTQVILNLVRNALEAGHKGNQVVIALRQDQGEVALTVRDHGPGLRPETIDKVFQPFFTTKPHGTGLGLAVALAIARNHGGSLTAANAPAGGAVFSLVLPAAESTAPGLGRRPDVAVAVADVFLRGTVEETLRAAGFATLSAPDLAGLAAQADGRAPRAVIVEAGALSGRTEADIAQAFGRAALIAVGQPSSPGGLGLGPRLEGLPLIPEPIDYPRLICTVRRALGLEDGRSALGADQ
jgi:signal transduction histidine kinase